MMTLPDLNVLRPASAAEAVEALRANPGARVLAGGTDIVPNLKYGMYDTQHLVALRGLSSELRYLREVEGDLLLGAMCTIDELARSEVMKARLPALADACSQIARPQLRPMGTLGGNPCLDTRCGFPQAGVREAAPARRHRFSRAQPRGRPRSGRELRPLGLARRRRAGGAASADQGARRPAGPPGGRAARRGAGPPRPQAVQAID